MHEHPAIGPAPRRLLACSFRKQPIGRIEVPQRSGMSGAGTGIAWRCPTEATQGRREPVWFIALGSEL
jgi:hypothetical protein